MARFSIEQPTQEYSPEYKDVSTNELPVVLTAGVFSEDLAAVLHDPHATVNDKLKAIGQARANDPADDLQRYLIERHDFRKDPKDVEGNLNNLFEGCLSYIRKQEKIQRRLDDADFVACITPYDTELLAGAPMKHKDELMDAIHSDYLTDRTEVADIQSVDGFSPWLETEKPEEAASLNTLPIPERLEKLRGYHQQFVIEEAEKHRRQTATQKQKDLERTTALNQERDAAEKLAELMANPALSSFVAKSKHLVAVDRLLEAGVPATKVLSLVSDQYRSNDFKKHEAKHNRKAARSQHAKAITLDVPKEVSYTPGLAEKTLEKIDKLKTDWTNLPPGVRRKKALVAGVALAATLFVGGATVYDSSKNPKSAIPVIGEAGNYKKTELHPPSEIAKQVAGLSKSSTIPEKLRTKIIIKGGEAYVKGRVGNISLELGKLSLGAANEGRLTINKMDEIALSSLDLLSRRPGVTPGMADSISQQISNIMLTARYPDDFDQDNLTTDHDSPFHKELVRLLEVTFKDDPGMERYSAEQREKIYTMQAEVIGTLTPESAQGDVLNVFLAILAQADKTLESAQKQHKAGKEYHKMEELNPRYTLGQIIAAISVYESGSPADPNAENWAECKGYMQFCYWSEWANEILGNPNAELNPANQTIVTMKKMLQLLHQTGSADAAAASWLKGPGIGIHIASQDKSKYDWAWNKKDGNNTTIGMYMSKMEDRIKDIDVHKQLPFLKEVMKNHPNAIDWSLLDKEFPLYSYHRLRQVKPHANQVIQDREERARRIKQEAANVGTATRTEKGGLKIKGATDLGMHPAFISGQAIDTRLYAVNGFKSSSEESSPKSKYYIDGSNRNVIVGARAVKSVVRMFNAAEADGITLTAFSSHRWNSHQAELWNPIKDSTYVARPKHSGHQDPRKSAIDFNVGGSMNARDYPTRNPHQPLSVNNPRVSPDNKAYEWLVKNAHKYGYVQYFVEPWHWSYVQKAKKK